MEDINDEWKGLLNKEKKKSRRLKQASVVQWIIIIGLLVVGILARIIWEFKWELASGKLILVEMENVEGENVTAYRWIRGSILINGNCSRELGKIARSNESGGWKWPKGKCNMTEGIDMQYILGITNKEGMTEIDYWARENETHGTGYNRVKYWEDDSVYEYRRWALIKVKVVNTTTNYWIEKQATKK